MDETELNKFVLKFKSLWSSGYDAHLDMDCHAGEAWVGLRLRLGSADRPHLHQHGVGKETPSKRRRRERRAAEQQVKKEHSVRAEEAAEETLIRINKPEEGINFKEKDTNDETKVPIKDTEEVIKEISEKVDEKVEPEVGTLSDENLVNFRVILLDPEDIEAFKDKVRQSFHDENVDINKQHLEISKVERYKDQTKFYIDIKEEATDALKKLKSEQVHIFVPWKKPIS